jgi:hypothetical protein
MFSFVAVGSAFQAVWTIRENSKTRVPFWRWPFYDVLHAFYGAVSIYELWPPDTPATITLIGLFSAYFVTTGVCGARDLRRLKRAV